MGQPILSEDEYLKLPLAKTDFAALRQEQGIYIDKTALVYKLALADSTPIFLTRPRRFGKSLLVSTFESLFRRGAADFAGLAIEELWQEDVSSYKVIHLDFSIWANKSSEDFKISFAKKLVSELEPDMQLKVYDESGRVNEPDLLLEAASKKLKAKSMVLLIDEYDSPISHHLYDPEELKPIQRMLSSFFATIKSCEGMFRFVFITGISRIVPAGMFSVFNNLKDITFDPDYAPCWGSPRRSCTGTLPPMCRMQQRF